SDVCSSDLKGAERAERLALIAEAPAPVVIYESPMRIVALIADLVAVCGMLRRVCVARELTKLHGEVFRRGLGAAACAPAVLVARGEYVVGVEGLEPRTRSKDVNLSPLFEGLAGRRPPPPAG